MPFLPEIILPLVASFAPLFSCPTWRHARILLIGAILCTGKRTVTSALRVMGLSNASNFSRYHRVLNAAKWNNWCMVQILLGLFLSMLPAGWPIIVAMDESVERRKGRKITAKGCYRDACRSSKGMVVVAELGVKKRGRKPLKGTKVSSLKELLQQPSLAWEQREIVWYGGEKKLVELHNGTNLWYTPGCKPLAIRWVLVRDLESGNVESFFSTEQNLAAETLVEYFVMRWNIEVTFEEARAHLGVETQRQWSDNAINRTTPVLFGLFSLVCLMAYKLTDGGHIPVAISAWYDKKSQAMFSDVHAYVKQAITREKYLNKSWVQGDMVQIPFEEFKTLIDIELAAA